jgi:phosphoribosyl-dephospho-CoA transferase
MRITPHDLLRISDSRDLVCSEEAPSWVAVSLTVAPYVVVRRAPNWNEWVPVGVRGPRRHQRFGAYLRYHSIQEQIAPGRLGREQGWLENRRSTAIPALNALTSVKKIMDDFALEWGPAGSVGFELASQTPTTTANSDLDLVVRAPDRISRELMSLVRTALSDLSCSIDIQIETPYGAVSVAEWVNGEGPFLRKQTAGPVLVADPWLKENSV